MKPSSTKTSHGSDDATLYTDSKDSLQAQRERSSSQMTSDSLYSTPLENSSAPVEGTKHDSGKLRFDLIPTYPLEELARVYTIGAKKYDDHNWRKGILYSRIFAAMMRHAWAWWRGSVHDPEDGQHHLSSVAWCAFTLMWFERFRPGYDDRADTHRSRSFDDNGWLFPE